MATTFRCPLFSVLLVLYFIVPRYPRILLTIVKISRLDRDLAIEQNEAAFDPEKEIRNYDEIARNLPVFCVSARAYQKLAGRFKQDAVQVGGFTSLDDTEIPQLQEHAKELTESGRITTARLFLNELNQLLNSMRFWTAGSTRMAVIETDEKYDEKMLILWLVGLKKVSTETFLVSSLTCGNLLL